MKVKDIAQKVKGQVIGNENLEITGITNIENPQAGHIAFINQAEQIKDIENTAISCLFAPAGTQSAKTTLIIVDNPKLVWAQALAVFIPPRQYPSGISAQAFVDPSAQIGDQVTIEPFVYVGKKVKIGNNTVLRAGCYIDDEAQIGNNTVIHPRVTVYDRSIIGNHVIIHAGTVIGADGFGYVSTDKGHLKVPQVGNVVIQDHVEIGANTAIDRATLGSTTIGMGAKIDNLVQIAHNVEFGAFAIASSQVGISGSSKIGKGAILAGQVGVADHCEIGDRAILGAQAGLATKKKIPANQIYFGSPARPYDVERKLLAVQPFLADSLKKLRDLGKKVEALEEQSRQTGKTS